MKAPLSWLKKYVNLTKESSELAEILTLAGLEVEKIEREQFSFEGVVVAKLLSVEAHPESEKLKIASVTDGKKTYQVVCGDTTIKEGLVVPLAKVGALLKHRSGEEIEIGKTKVRSVESNGMLCSSAELGLNDNAQEVYRLPKTAPLGEDLGVFLYDPTFNIALTPNLGHCRSVYGIARELGIQLGEPYHPPEIVLEEDPDNPAKGYLQISNEDHQGCLQYEVRVITGVQIKESPDWLKEYLEKTDHSIINNVVDVTNFVMEEMGQPLHAFDADELPENHIVIRSSTEGEKIVTLDEEERVLKEGVLLICDGEVPIAIAGIMGGRQSGISEKTNTIILEAAQFDPSRIRKASREIGLRSDSSARFENQIDPAGLRFALDRAASLIQEVAGGHVLSGVASQSPKPYLPRFMTARLSKINGLLGTKFSLNEVEGYLARMGIACSTDGDDLFQIRIPSYRNDIHTEVDIIEEIAKLFGFNNITRARPRHVNSLIGHHPLFLLEKEVRARLVSKGLQEFVNCDLISPALCDIELENGLFKPEYIKVMHAKSIDQSILRPSLLPGLLTSVKHNQNHGNFDICAFEIGRVHFKEEDRYDEKSVLGIVLSGRRNPIHWDQPEEEFDFYDLKGVIEDLATLLLLPKLDFVKSSLSTFHPGRQASLVIEEERIGVIGEVHPQSLNLLDIRGRALFCEINLHLVEKWRSKITRFSDLAQFPSSERDLTLTIKKEKSLAKLFDILERIDEPLLKSSQLLDIYEGEKIGLDNKNVTFRFVYRRDDKTIDINEIESAHAKVTKLLQKAL